MGVWRRELVEATVGSAKRVIGGVNELVLKMKELSRNTNLRVVDATMSSEGSTKEDM